MACLCFLRSRYHAPFAGVAWWSCSSLDDDWGRAASLGRADTDEYIELVLRSKLSGLGGDFVGATLLRLLTARKLILAADPTGDLTKKRAICLPRRSVILPASLPSGIEGELTTR